MNHEQFEACRDACARCAQECEACATACLSEPDVKVMAECIRLDRDCAAVCWLAASFLSRRSEFDVDVCRLCASVCDSCAAECERHEPDHCRRCAAACRRCAEECRTLAEAT